MKKCIFSARISQFIDLIKTFNKYEGSKCQTIVNKHKILKSNDFATQKWRILRPGRIV